MIRQFLLTLELPDWARWYAIDREGDVYVYSRRPKKCEECWDSQQENQSLWDEFVEYLHIAWIDPQSIPEFNWEKTCHKIPRAGCQQG